MEKTEFKREVPNLKIALLGDIGIGKSTVLNRVLSSTDEVPYGFRTLPVIEGSALRGFKIVNLRTSEEASIGYFDENFLIHPVTDGFETVGAEALEQALSFGRVIVMDELGFLEKDATEFKNLVFRVLQSDKLVFYVVKSELNPFLKNTLKFANRIFEVNKENRDKLPDEIRRYLWDYMKISSKA